MSWSITKRLLNCLTREHLAKHGQRSGHCGTCLLIAEAEGFCATEEAAKEAKKLTDDAVERSFRRRIWGRGW